LTTSLAAQRRLCSPFAVFAARVTCTVAAVFLFSFAAHGVTRENLPGDSSSPTVLFSASLDLVTGKEVLVDHASAEQQTMAAVQQYVI
jgi:hypothetical protein